MSGEFFRSHFFMQQIEIDNFYNDGFGWICKHCERELKAEHSDNCEQHSRLMIEGEAESKQTEFSSKAMAKWLDAAQTTLTCPRCGTTEKVDKF